MPKEIIVVGDTTSEAHELKTALNAHSPGSYEIIAAEGSANCIELLEHATPDLIILDAEMAKGAGWDICAWLKSNERTKAIPVVFLMPKPDPLKEGLGKLEAADCIVKPFDGEDLTKRIGAVLEK